MLRVAPVAALLCITATFAAAQPFTESAIDRLVDASLAAWDVPGAAVVIVNRNRPLYEKGFGVCKLGEAVPVTPDTSFPLASCTKAFTTTLGAMLSDDGKLHWDDPVRKHIAWFHLADPLADGDVRLRDLALHRTGLATHDFLWYRAPWSLKSAVERTARLPLAKPFRTEFQYQNMTMAAVGLATESAAGQPWKDLVRTRLFEPLGMRTATATAPPAGTPRASPHRPDAAGRLQVIKPYEPAEPNPAGSIHASARDLAPWLMFHLSDGQFGGKRLVSADAFAELHTPQMLQRIDALTAATHPNTLQMSYALGWVVMDYRGQLIWAHTGAIDGYRAQIALAPQSGLGIAVLSNRHQTRMNLALINNLLDRLVNLSTRDWDGYLKAVVEQDDRGHHARREHRDRLKDPGGRPPRPLADYAGLYHNASYGDAEIIEASGRLEWQWNQFRFPLGYHHGNEFDVRDDDLRDPVVHFVEKDGRVVGYQMFDVEFRRQVIPGPLRPPA